MDLQKYAEQKARDQAQAHRAEEECQQCIGSGDQKYHWRNPGNGGLADYNNDAIDGQGEHCNRRASASFSFKPYVYATVLKKKQMNAASMILDVPMTVPLGDGTFYRPENDDRQYHGPVSFRNALARSYTAIKVMDEVGIAMRCVWHTAWVSMVSTVAWISTV